MELLSRKSREHLFVRANHTFPLGMISMDGTCPCASLRRAPRLMAGRARFRRSSSEGSPEEDGAR
jgi:hypothetical protein